MGAEVRMIRQLGTMELGHVVFFLLNHVGRDEDEERIEFGHMDLSFDPVYFPDISSFPSGFAVCAW